MAMEPLELAAESREYVLVPCGTKIGDEPVDPVGDGYTAEMAFVAVDGRPAAGDWKAAEWESANGVWSAMCLVGPGGTVELPEGTYDVWVKVTGPTAEIPVHYAPGRVRVV